MIYLITLLAFFCQLLGNEELNEKYKQAREYELPRAVFHDGRFIDGFVEIGPDGIKNTLASMEFPWRHPGGTLSQPLTRKFVWPTNIEPASIRQALFKTPTRVAGPYASRPAWSWPKGSTFFEVHYHPVHKHPFEVRVLEKVDSGYGFDNYDAHVFAPIENDQDLPFNAQVVSSQRVRIDSGHPLNNFTASGVLHLYEDAPENFDWIKFVGSREWPEVTGREWHHAGKGDNWLTPKNYHSWITGSDRDSCAKCHDRSGQHVTMFEPFRDWYGYIQGADGIFSFDPIDRSLVVPGTMLPRRGYKWRNN